MEIDPRWELVKTVKGIAVCYDGLQVALSSEKFVIQVELPNPLDLQLLLIRQQFGQCTVPEWQVKQGSFWLGDKIVFSWLKDIDLAVDPIWQNNELSLCWKVEPGQCCRQTTILWKKKGFVLNNSTNRKLRCSRPDLIVQLLEELQALWPNSALDQCLKFIKTQTIC